MNNLQTTFLVRLLRKLIQAKATFKRIGEKITMEEREKKHSHININLIQTATENHQEDMKKNYKLIQVVKTGVCCFL